MWTSHTTIITVSATLRRWAHRCYDVEDDIDHEAAPAFQLACYGKLLRAHSDGHISACGHPNLYVHSLPSGDTEVWAVPLSLLHTTIPSTLIDEAYKAAADDVCTGREIRQVHVCDSPARRGAFTVHLSRRMITDNRVCGIPESATPYLECVDTKSPKIEFLPHGS
jgi:hypothetical protein